MSTELETQKNDQSDDISLSQLVSFYKNNFAISKPEAQVIKDARNEVNENYAAVADTIYKDSCVTVCKLEELIKQLNQGWQPAFTAGIIRLLKPDKAGPDNTPKSGFYRLLLAFTIFLLFSSTKTVLSILYVYYISK